MLAQRSPLIPQQALSSQATGAHRCAGVPGAHSLVAVGQNLVCLSQRSQVSPGSSSPEQRDRGLETLNTEVPSLCSPDMTVPFPHFHTNPRVQFLQSQMSFGCLGWCRSWWRCGEWASAALQGPLAVAEDESRLGLGLQSWAGWSLHLPDARALAS